jgi:preprotein translocase subunit SecD
MPTDYDRGYAAGRAQALNEAMEIARRRVWSAEVAEAKPVGGNYIYLELHKIKKTMEETA